VYITLEVRGLIHRVYEYKLQQVFKHIQRTHYDILRLILVEFLVRKIKLVNLFIFGSKLSG